MGIIIAGLTEGVNFPKRTDIQKPIMDLSNCNDIVVADIEYLKKNREILS